MPLTDLQISQAKTRLASGESLSSIARDLDINKGTLSIALKSSNASCNSPVAVREPLFWNSDQTEIRWKNFLIGIFVCFCLGAGGMVIFRGLLR